MSRLSFNPAAFMLALILFMGMFAEHDHDSDELSEESHVCVACSAADVAPGYASAVPFLVSPASTPYRVAANAQVVTTAHRSYLARAPPSVA